jgi:hypothetical protein
VERQATLLDDSANADDAAGNIDMNAENAAQIIHISADDAAAKIVGNQFEKGELFQVLEVVGRLMTVALNT